MYNVLKRLIENKFFHTKEEILEKVDTFYLVNKLNKDEYVELINLINEKYK